VGSNKLKRKPKLFSDSVKDLPVNIANRLCLIIKGLLFFEIGTRIFDHYNCQNDQQDQKKPAKYDCSEIMNHVTPLLNNWEPGTRDWKSGIELYVLSYS